MTETTPLPSNLQSRDNQPPAIDVRAAGLDFGGEPLFENLSLTLPAGGWTCLLGPSGVGKTTLLRLVAGLVAPWQGTTVTDNDGRGLAGRVAYMAQQDLLLPWLTARENVALGARLRGRRPDGARAEALLERVGLAAEAHRRPDGLSGGQRQRVALARTLMEDAPVVLMDEPFTALDAVTRHDLQAAAHALLTGRTVLFVTHDPFEALRLGDRVYVMAGRPARLGDAVEPDGAAPRDIHEPAIVRLHAEIMSRLLQGESGRLMRYLRPIVILLGIVALWQAVIWTTGIERFILPGPAAVAGSLFHDAAYLAENALVTISEIVIGLALGILLGCWTAIGMAASRGLRDWMLPVLVASQAIPVFALAPILVLWFGFGIWPKIAMATLIIYFPVTAAFFDGLRRSEPGWLDLASTMGASRWRILRHIRIPSALPSLASGIRVATAVAPIGAVVGEWVGASAGLGHVMVQSRAQANEPRMFAALFILAIVAVGLYVAIDHLLRLLLPWQRESNPNED